MEKSDSRCSGTTNLAFPHTLQQLSKETQILKNECRIIENQTQPVREWLLQVSPCEAVLWVGHDKQAFHPAIFSSILPFPRMTVHFSFLCIISLVIITRLPAFYNFFSVNVSHGAMRSFFQRQLTTSYKLYSRTCNWKQCRILTLYHFISFTC